MVRTARYPEVVACCRARFGGHEALRRESRARARRAAVRSSEEITFLRLACPTPIARPPTREHASACVVSVSVEHRKCSCRAQCGNGQDRPIRNNFSDRRRHARPRPSTLAPYAAGMDRSCSRVSRSARARAPPPLVMAGHAPYDEDCETGHASKSGRFEANGHVVLRWNGPMILRESGTRCAAGRTARSCP
jgi:hypothetical protein